MLKKFFPLFLSVCVLFLMDRDQSHAKKKKAHAAVKERFCTVCHTSVAFDPSYPSPGSLTVDITLLCNDCHASDRTEHRVGMPPQGEIADTLPLNKQGEIDCNTCHDLHDKSGHEMMLRKSTPGLCTLCHKK